MILPAFALALLAGGSGDTLDAAEIALALDRMSTVGSVLYVAAHPDDENTALLAWLARERGVRAAYLSITRGDGGQNLIGDEKGELIGLLRTEELLAARRIDGAEQFFTRAIDFGYSKSPEETLSIWGHDEVLSDVVRVIRSFKPDVIVSRFPTTGEGGHGHHTASAILAEEAFAAAADAARFPGTGEPWKTKRLFWNSFRPADASKLQKADVGAFNPLLGRSYTEIAAESRSQHKSQGFGSPERRGSRMESFECIAGEKPSGPDADLLEGVDLTWARVPGSEAVARALADARAAFDVRRPEAVVPLVLKARSALAKLPDDRRIAAKRRDLDLILRSAAGLWLEAVAGGYAAAPGETVALAATAINRSGAPLTLESVELTLASNADTKGAKLPATLERNQPLRLELRATLPKDAPFTGPCWLRRPPTKGLFVLDDPSLIGLPDAPPPLRARFVVRADGEAIPLEVPVVYRWTDPVKGDQWRPFEISPRVTLDFASHVLVFPDASPRTVTVRVKSAPASASLPLPPNVFGGRPAPASSAPAESDRVAGVVRLRVPEGWTVEPAERPFELTARDDARTAEFTVRPPAAASAGAVTAEAEIGGARLSRSLVRVEYPHVPIRTLFPPAEARLVRADVATRGKEIGYLAGSGDDVGDLLAQLGFRVVPLGAEEIRDGDLSRFDAIVTGVRAYNVKSWLKGAAPRLFDYVERGGTLVVQYNTTADLVTDRIGPRPFRISRDRVTVEEAPVALSDHPVLRTPNKIGAADFEGWVQERGLYFAGEWDPSYETPLEMHDPGEPPRRGSLLFEKHGKGVFVYTGLSFFRQLPAGVPGAWRLFANLVSARAAHD